MNKRVIIAVAIGLIALASLSIFLDLHGTTGNFASPVTVSIYSILTFIALATIAVFIVFKK